MPPHRRPNNTPPLFRGGVNVVRVDVIVTGRDGNPILDLAPSDFEIVEQRAPQVIETFKLVALAGDQSSASGDRVRQVLNDRDEEAEAAREDVRVFAVFFDDYHVRWDSSVQAREQLARFVDTQLWPSDLIGLMLPMQPTASVRLGRNHRALSASLSKL